MRLNRVRVSQQVLFMSDILTASGNKIDINAGIRRAEEDSRSELRWPKEQPKESDFQLWRNALQMICPSKSRALTVGKFKTRTHQIWKWSWNKEAHSLHRLQPDGETEDMCVSGRKPNRFHYSHSQQQGEHKTICTVEPTIDGEHYQLTSAVTKAPPAMEPKTFREVLLLWGNTWIWDHLSIAGGDRWVCVCFWPPVTKWGTVMREIPISSPPLDDIPSIP